MLCKGIIFLNNHNRYTKIEIKIYVNTHRHLCIVHRNIQAYTHISHVDHYQLSMIQHFQSMDNVYMYQQDRLNDHLCHDNRNDHKSICNNTKLNKNYLINNI